MAEDAWGVETQGLDVGTLDQDVLARAYTGYTVPWRDTFNQVCDRLSVAYPTEKAIRRFLVHHGFDLPNQGWFTYHVLRYDGEKDWAQLTEAWILALLRDRATRGVAS